MIFAGIFSHRILCSGGVSTFFCTTWTGWFVALVQTFVLGAQQWLKLTLLQSKQAPAIRLYSVLAVD